MNFGEEFKLVWATLRTHRFRSFLTLFGIILGVATLVSLSSAIASAGHYMKRTMQEASGEDIVSVSSKWWEEENANAPPLSRFDSRALAHTPSLAGSMVLNRYTMRVPWGERWGQNVWVVGTLPEAFEFYSLAMATGRFLTAADIRDRVPVAILGTEAAKQLFPKNDVLVGLETKLKGERFRVIGVMKDKPSLGKGEFWTWDKAVVIAETAFVDRFVEDKKGLREIVVKARPTTVAMLGLERLVSIARAIVLWRHHGTMNFKITDPTETSRVEMITTLVAGGLEAVVAGVCLLVGGINLMNIMLVSVLQRTREIGIKRALGATRGSIGRSFLAEAAILAGLGGLFGALIGLGFAWAIALVLTKTIGYWPFVIPWLEVALGLGAALVTGIVFGYYPARKAANLMPIECLQHE